MEVYIGEIKDKKGGEIKFHLVEDWSDLGLDGQSLGCIGPVTLDGRVTCTGEIFLVKGTVTTKVTAACSRCLGSVELHLTAQVDERFRKASHPHEQDRVREQEIDENDWGNEDIQEFRGLTIHLDDVVTENLVVSLPIKPLCQEDCRGLCPLCGHDLNDGDCDCTIDTIDPRMSKLQQLLDSND